MSRKLGIVIQARTGSTRLPGKILAKIEGVPLILHVYYRIQANFDLPIIVATTNNSKDNELVNLLNGRNINVFRGNEEDVLDRFIEASVRLGITDVVRICSDNPFLDVEYLEQLRNVWKKNTISDYISFEFNNKPVVLSHFGIFGEIVKLSALEKVAKIFPGDKNYFEHVTSGVYMNPQIFKIHLVNLDKELTQYEGIRLTIDTKDDLLRVSNLMQMSKNKNFRDIADYILSQPHLLEGMKDVIKDQQK